MADFAVGTWNLVETENFDEYMKAVGVGMVMRKMGATVKPTQEISVDGNKWTIKTKSTMKNTEVDFVLGEEFDETTADGRNVKSVNTLDGQTLTTVQKGEPDSTITREWSGDTMTMKLSAKDAVCTRIYKKA
ncbi:Fatty acid-binding protein [Mactra antiquata]